MRYTVGRAGIVENVVESPVPVVLDGFDVLEDPGPTFKNVGNVYDVKEAQFYRDVTVATFRVLYRHENMIRQLVRALRATSTAGNTQATAAGLPTTANSPDLTLAQAVTAFKNLIP